MKNFARLNLNGLHVDELDGESYIFYESFAHYFIYTDHKIGGYDLIIERLGADGEPLPSEFEHFNTVSECFAAIENSEVDA